MPARPLSPAQNLDLRQIVYEKIKEAIIEGVFPKWISRSSSWCRERRFAKRSGNSPKRG
jgi:hypothetical protein